MGKNQKDTDNQILIKLYLIYHLYHAINEHLVI